MSETKSNKKTLIGTVVSDKMDKTVVVRTERQFKHKLYGKYMRRNSQYMAHDPSESAAIGDRILIQECRPLSKHKRWRVVKVVEKAV
ncbi:MAG: 30S ribosomal protein S17 [Thermodesulfobacteriota bacterium]